MFDVFIISPFTHEDDSIVQQRVELTETYVANLIKQGLTVQSQIAMLYYLTTKHDIPITYDFWRKYCHQMLEACEQVHVLCLDGWEQSVGVDDEIKLARRLNKRITYVTL
jgi:capsule polysaccharide modification protein KpsS